MKSLNELQRNQKTYLQERSREKKNYMELYKFQQKINMNGADTIASIVVV